MSPGQGGITLESGVKHVISMDMPHLDEVAADRRRAMTTHGTSISYLETDDTNTFFSI